MNIFFFVENEEYVETLIFQKIMIEDGVNYNE